MKAFLRKHLRPALFFTGGAAAELLCYVLWGCTGSCPITSSPWITMVYTGIIGWLLCGVTARKEQA